MTGRELHWNIDGHDVAVRIEESFGHGTFHLGDRSFRFRILERNSQGGWIEIDGKPHQFYVLRERDSYTVWFNGRTYRLARIEKGRIAQAAAAAGRGEIMALMPGKILRIEVAVGDTVTEKQAVVIVESMKMETALHAPKTGRVTSIHCLPGQVVEMGELLMVIE